MKTIWSELRERHGDVIKYVMDERRISRSLLSVDGSVDEIEAECTDPTHDHSASSQSTPRHIPTTADQQVGPDDDPTAPLNSLENVGEFEPPRRFGMPDMNMDQLNSTPPSTPRRKLCQWGAGGGNSPTDLLKASMIWSRGFKGAGIRIAIFDTGLSKTHSHFANVDERTNWTDESTLEDGLGHGTFVAGVIASQRDCLGFAPEARLHVFRVFNQRQLSFTSWFLDAFNYAIHSRVHLLNLSIGGPDFLDRPFVEKVNEMSANGITVISAIGNDGPLWGTLNNPADQMDVIGVGGSTEDNKVAPFSSRGMTTGELPLGYGRMKPDLVTYSRNIRSSNQGSGCKTMSGTSVASPVVAGALTLLASSIPDELRTERLNPAYLKQLLMESVVRLPTNYPNAPGIFEQGEGALSLENAFQLLTDDKSPFEPHASIVPAKLDLTDCPYMWPYCTQGLYYSSVPLILNLTILNSQSVSSFIPDSPKFHPADDISKSSLHFRYTFPESFWPWSGWFGIHVTIKEPLKIEQILSGYIEIPLQSDDDSGRLSIIKLPIKLNGIPTPPRSKRIIFDAFHNLRYPSGYFPRDNLEIKIDTLDWNGDHLHTNYRELYTVLRDRGYFLEVLGRDFTCFDASLYSTLLLIDPEEEYFIEEVSKLQDDFYLEGLNLLILADWYNTRIMREIKFYDENTAEWWTPETGGANIPALNSLLAGFGVQLTDHVVKGDIHIANEMIYFASGSTIGRWPATGSIGQYHLIDAGSGAPAREYAVVGVYDPTVKASPLSEPYPNAGRLFVYTDSNCVDMNHRRLGLCGNMILEALNFFTTGDRSKLFKSSVKPLTTPYVDTTFTKLPRRSIGNNLIKYSKVTSAGSAPQCPIITVPTVDQSSMPPPSPLTAVTSYEQSHTAFFHASVGAGGPAGAPTSADELKANMRFSSTIQKLQHQRPRRRPPIEEDSTQLVVTTIDTSKPAPVLAKQARLNPSLDLVEVSPIETAELFATSPHGIAAGETVHQMTPKQFWMRFMLFTIIVCIIIVAYLYRRSIRQHTLIGKHSPVQTPMLPPKSSQQPRSMVL